jgi:hypothetical protein
MTQDGSSNLPGRPPSSDADTYWQVKDTNSGDQSNEMPDKKVLSHATDDTREYINIQIDTLNQLGDRAGKTARLNLIIIGLFFTALAFFLPSGAGRGQLADSVRPFLNLFLIGGVIASIESLLLSLWTYNRTRGYAGLDGHHIDKILDNEYDETEFLNQLLQGHKSWIEENQTVNTQDAHRLVVSNTALFLSVVYLGFSLIYGVDRSLIPHSLLVFISAGLAVGLVSVIPYIPLRKIWDKVRR